MENNITMRFDVNGNGLTHKSPRTKKKHWKLIKSLQKNHVKNVLKLKILFLALIAQTC